MSLASLYPFLISLKAYLSAAAPYLSAAAFVLAIILVLLHFSLRRRLTRLALGRNGSIEETIAVLLREVKELKEFRREIEKYLKASEVRLRSAIQGVGLVRFNPFSGDGSGGDQSFAAAFIDERGNGVVFSSLYARDRVGVYAKPLENFVSTYELTAEEKSAVDKAKQALADNKKRIGA